MDSFIEEVILSHDDIVAICERLGAQITHDYQGKDPVLVGLLKGSVPFLAELMKHIHTECTIDFMHTSSYAGVTSTGSVKVLHDLQHSCAGKHVILVEDIIDTGYTLSKVMELLKDRAASSVEIVTLLDKKEARKTTHVTPKYIGAAIPSKFVVGFGLDYEEHYRNLDYIGVLKPEIYMK